MKEITEFDNRPVEIWRRPRQRRMNLRVKPDGGLRVTCNKGVERREIFLFIAESDEFIQRSLKRISEQRERYPLKHFETGEEFLILGERVPLNIIWSWQKRIRVEKTGGILEMVAPLASTRIERKTALIKYFQREGRKLLLEKASNWAREMNAIPRTIAIRGQSTRWGSCTSKGVINLNWKLLSAPPEIIDYVVIHELAHLEQMNHSTRFWRLVGEYFPDYAKAKRWLRTHEPEIASQFL